MRCWDTVSYTHLDKAPATFKLQVSSDGKVWKDIEGKASIKGESVNTIKDVYKRQEYEEKDKKVKRYEAEFEYAGAQYEIKGVVEKEEFEKMCIRDSDRC